MNVPVKTQIPTTTESRDLSLEMQQCDIEFVFTRLTTKTWRETRLILQRRADVFMYSPDKTTAYAGFKITPENAKKVADIYLRIYRWKSAFVRIKNTDVETLDDINNWAYCWIMAHTATDKDKYCNIRNWDPWLHTNQTDWMDYLNRPATCLETRMRLPCKCVHFQPDLDKPGQMFEQYMDAARERGCDKCPLFKASQFKMRVLEPDEPTARESMIEWERITHMIDQIGKEDE